VASVEHEPMMGVWAQLRTAFKNSYKGTRRARSISVHIRISVMVHGLVLLITWQDGHPAF